MAAAVLVHAAVMLVVVDSDVKQRLVPAPEQRVDVALLQRAPVEPTPESVPEPTPVAVPPPARAGATSPAPAMPAVPEPTTTPEAVAAADGPAVPPAPAPEAPESLLRQRGGPTGLDAVLGTRGPLGASQAALEGALDLKVDGPVRDSIAAARTATRHLQEDLADDAVTAGLADDYFRELHQHITTAWQPAMKELNDGGASTTQLGMLSSFAADSSAWGEAWQAYLDLARQYANGVPPQLAPARVERLRELFRSRKGAFRVHAIAEVKLTLDPTGTIQLLEFTMPSGHTGIDQGIGAAIENALAAMPAPPPPRLHHGRSFSSHWRLRATWSMVPPTALFSGTSFDVTPKGFSVDVPFQIKLNTNVMLNRTDARPGP